MFPEPSTSLPDTKDTYQSGKKMQNIFDEQKISLRPSGSIKNVLRWHLAICFKPDVFATSFRTPTYIQMV